MLDKIRAEIEQIKPYDYPCDKRTPEHIRDMALEIVEKYAEQEPKILDTIDFAIDASNGDTNYFVGFRNGLRCAKSLIDGEEPQYESCAEQEPKKGTWSVDIDHSRGWDWRRFYCSECGSWQIFGEPKFCPNCGARMEVFDDRRNA